MANAKAFKVVSTDRGIQLSKPAMLARVQISVLSRHVRDEEITAEVLSNHNAESGSGKFVKELMAGVFVETTRAQSRLRGIHEKRTFKLPATGGGQIKGPRLIPNDMVEDYLTEMYAAIDDFEVAVEKECSALSKFVAAEKLRLGAMFKADDYPSKEYARSQFSATVHVDGMPTVESIDAGKYTADLRADAAEKQSEIASTVARQLIVQLLEHVGHAANKLTEAEKNEKAKIFPSLLDNVDDIVNNVIPKVGLEGDDDLVSLCDSVRKMLNHTTAELQGGNLKALAATRKAAVSAAKKIGKEAKKRGVTVNDYTATNQSKVKSYF